MKVIVTKSVGDRVSKVRNLIKSAGNQLFAISFIKRSDGSRRKMVARRKVREPQYVKAPSGKVSYRRAQQDDSKNLMTVFDCNCLKYNRQNRLNGRGSYKSIPLDAVTRIKVGGEIYKIM